MVLNIKRGYAVNNEIRTIMYDNISYIYTHICVHITCAYVKMLTLNAICIKPEVGSSRNKNYSENIRIEINISKTQ